MRKTYRRADTEAWYRQQKPVVDHFYELAKMQLDPVPPAEEARIHELFCACSWMIDVLRERINDLPADRLSKLIAVRAVDHNPWTVAIGYVNEYEIDGVISDLE